MDEEIRLRIKLVMQLKDKQISYLERLWNLKEGTGANYFRKPTENKKPTKISPGNLALFAEATGVDLNWLSTGQGISPFSEESVSRASEPAPIYNPAKAGRLTAQNAAVQIRNLLAKAIDQVQEGQYEIFTVDGNSMHPTLFDGDKLLCRLITLDELTDNRIHVVVTNRREMKEIHPDGVWVKRCAYRKDNGYINCRSDNKDSSEPFYTFRLNPGEVDELWLPVLRLTGNMSDPNRDIYDKLDDIEGRLEMLESLNE